MSYKLLPASILDGEIIVDMLNEIPENENGFINHGLNVSIENFKEYRDKLLAESNGINIKSDRVSQTTYWLLKDGYPIGISKLRTKLTESLRNGAGHIGYTIRPSERSKGYGNIILEETLKKAINKGLDQVLISCEKTNIPSKKIIEKNGGIFEKELNDYLLYWIVF